MKECEKIKYLLSAYYDNNLEDNEIETVEAHLEKCEYCRREVEIYKNIENSLFLNENEMPSEKYFNRIRESVRNGIEKEYSKEKKISIIEYIFGNLLKPVPAAVIMSVIVIMGMYYFENVIYEISQKKNNIAINYAFNPYHKRLDKIRTNTVSSSHFAKKSNDDEDKIQTNEDIMFKNEKVDAVESVETGDNSVAMTFTIDNGRIPVVWVMSGSSPLKDEDK